MKIINEFMTRYAKEYDFYDSAARICAQQIESRIRKSGIRGIVTSRAKNQDRLKDKLVVGNEKNKYASVEDIYSRIIDLAGVRIALYFPSEKFEIDKILRSQFDLYEPPIIFDKKDIKNIKEKNNHTHIYKERFSGYHATHYRVNLKPTTLEEHQLRYKEAKIEIQVASVLMHAWSEVEHDLVYKPMQGYLSVEEYSLLDQLNGLVLSGEIALELLNKAIEVRVGEGKRTFTNHYELSSYLFENTKYLLSKDSENEILIGDVDILFLLLMKLDLLSPEKIQSYIINLDPDTLSRSISEQIIDRIIAGDEGRYEEYRKIVDSIALKREPEETKTAIGTFISSWINLEILIRENLSVRNQGKAFYRNDLLNSDMLDKAMIEKYEYLRRIRNYLVHGIEIPDAQFILGASKKIETLTKAIAARLKKGSK